MKLKQLASNMTELQFDNGTIIVLFSYEMPVAAVVIYEANVHTTIKTNKKYSVTTTRHINKWLHDLDQRGIGDTSSFYVDQETIDNLVKTAQCIE